MLDPNRFVTERRPGWRELEQELDAIAAGEFGDFTFTRARRLGELYRRAAADLIRARTETANRPMIDYLNGLVGRSYGTIYRGRALNPYAAISFIAIDFPRQVRAQLRSILAAMAVFLAGVLFGVLAEVYDSSAKFSLLPANYAQIEDHIETFKTKAAAPGALPPGLSTGMSAFIMTNNIRVSFLAFALGATLGIGTVLILFHNGVLLGVLAAVFARHSLSLYFWAFILPHGIIELAAIFIAGGAGFLIARALVAPGDHGRREALRHYGGEAIRLILGCAFLLIIAGLIEGFITPQAVIPHGLKLIFASATLVALVAYIGANEMVLVSLGLLVPRAAKPDAMAFFEAPAIMTRL